MHAELNIRARRRGLRNNKLGRAVTATGQGNQRVRALTIAVSRVHQRVPGMPERAGRREAGRPVDYRHEECHTIQQTGEDRSYGST